MERKTYNCPKKDVEKLFRGCVFLIYLAGAFVSSISALPIALSLENTIMYAWFLGSLVLVLLLSSSVLGVFIIPLLVFQLGYVFEELAIKLMDSISKGSFRFIDFAFFIIATPVFFLSSTVGMSSSKRIREAVQNAEAENAALSRLI